MFAQFRADGKRSKAKDSWHHFAFRSFTPGSPAFANSIPAATSVIRISGMAARFGDRFPCSKLTIVIVSRPQAAATSSCDQPKSCRAAFS
jgi:hypothetical protein